MVATTKVDSLLCLTAVQILYDDNNVFFPADLTTDGISKMKAADLTTDGIMNSMSPRQTHCSTHRHQSPAPSGPQPELPSDFKYLNKRLFRNDVGEVLMVEICRSS